MIALKIFALYALIGIILAALLYRVIDAKIDELGYG